MDIYTHIPATIIEGLKTLIIFIGFIILPTYVYIVIVSEDVFSNLNHENNRKDTNQNYHKKKK